MARPATRSVALLVVRRLREAGHQALFAGGCVRDMLLGHRPGDYDVATDATPRQVRRLFRRVLLVGAQFGVAMVLLRGRRVEVATFRTEGGYSDHRRPDRVEFSSPREDALRRDFTINGMFYDPIAREVIDFVGGRDDLRRRVVRTIGDPRKRFGEDYLRLVRAVRFAVRLDFRIDPATAEAAAELAPKIREVSGERILEELSKMLALPSAPRALGKLAELRLASQIVPELFDPPDLWQRAVDRVESVSKRRSESLSLGAMLAELPARTIRRILRRWGGSNQLVEEARFYARHLGDWRTAADWRLCEFKRLMASPCFDGLRALWRHEERRKTGALRQSRRIARRMGKISPDQVSPHPLVTGEDLLEMGLPEGPAIGRVLRELYDAQLDEELTTRKDALARARKLVDEAS